MLTGPVRHHRLRGDGARGDDQQDADEPVPRRRPRPGGVHDGADHRHGRSRARPRPGRGPPAQHDRARRPAPGRGASATSSPARSSTTPATTPTCLERALELLGLRRRSASSRSGRSRRAAARDRDRLLRRGDRARPLRDGNGRIEPSGEVVVLTGACTQRPGPPDHARPGRRRHARASTSTTSRSATATPTWCAGASGTYASRTAAIGGTAIRNASGAVREQGARDRRRHARGERLGPGAARTASIRVVGSPGGPGVTLARGRRRASRRARRAARRDRRLRARGHRRLPPRDQHLRLRHARLQGGGGPRDRDRHACSSTTWSTTRAPSSTR